MLSPGSSLPFETHTHIKTEHDRGRAPTRIRGRNARCTGSRLAAFQTPSAALGVAAQRAEAKISEWLTSEVRGTPHHSSYSQKFSPTHFGSQRKRLDRAAN